MPRNLIPGHVLAATIWTALILASASFGLTGRFSAAAGVLILLIGLFLVDQATHLRQPAHSDPAPTWIERNMQERPGLHFILGRIIALIGLLLMIR